MPNTDSTIIALDVGERRVGVALATAQARLAHPHTTLIRTDEIWYDIAQLAGDHQTAILVVGLPRGLSGQETAQTRAAEEFADELKQHIDIPVYLQDEAVTSRQAETELIARGKPYQKGDIDALAATYILEDFLREHPEVPHHEI